MSDYLTEINQSIVDINSDAPDYPWRYEPVPFEEFVTSKDHMRFPKLSPKQLEAAWAVLPREPKKTFETELKQFLVSCCLWGQGSGKDSCSALISCYVAYILLCLKNPYYFLTGYDVPGEPMDLINVACNFEQASNVFFTKFKSRVQNWTWLRKNFRVRESQSDLDPVKDRESGTASKKVVTIYPTAVKFPNNIRAFSRHSLVKGAEGYNPILWILDEASDMNFEDADSLYKMFYNSANSRFPNKWTGFVLSFPRHRHDFTVHLYEEAAAGRLPKVFPSKGATWEINPTKKYEDFKDELENPATRRDALSRLACEPPAQKEAFFEDVEKVKACVNVEHKQIAEFISTRRKMPTGVELIGKVLSRYLVPRYSDSKKCVAHVDLGRCFTGDTKVSLLDGRDLSFLQLIEEYALGKELWTYSIDADNKKIVPKRILDPHFTKRSEVVRVTLDNGESVRCTPEHLFMLRDGTYRKAKDLLPNESLMPLYRKYAKNGLRDYELFYDHFEDGWHYTHWEFCHVARKGYVVHHIDYNHRNNNPTNLQYLTQTEHTIIHNRFQSLDEKRKRSNSIKNFRRVLRQDVETHLDYRLSQIMTQTENKSLKRFLEETDIITRRQWLVFRDLCVILKRVMKLKFCPSYDSLSGSERRGISSKFQFYLNPQLGDIKAKQIRESNAIRWTPEARKEQSSIFKELRETHPSFESAEISARCIGRTAWNRGLTKETDERIAVGSAKMSEAKKAMKIPAWNRGLTKETDTRLAKYGRRGSETKRRQKVVAWNKGLTKETDPRVALGVSKMSSTRWGHKLNHKVVSVESCGIEDVYDLEIEGTHNFPLSAGVFVHNSHDLCGLAVGHLEGTRVIFDLIMHWEADRENKIPIDIDDPANVLIELKKNFMNLVLCSFDQWNSASSQQRLNRANIVTIQKGNTFEDYKLWRQKTYERNIEYPDYPKLTDPTFGEIVNLQLLNNDKVDHPRENTNDISECCVGVVSRLLGTKKNVADAQSMEDHYQENEKDAMDSIWASENIGNEATSDPFSEGISGISVKLR